MFKKIHAPHHQRPVTTWVALFTMLLWSFGVQCCCVGKSCCEATGSATEQAGAGKSCCSAAQNKSSPLPKRLRSDQDDAGARLCSCGHHDVSETSVAKIFVLSPGWDTSIEDETPVEPFRVAASPSFRAHLCGPPGARGPPVV